MNKKIPVLCECNSFSCSLNIYLPVSEYMIARDNRNFIIINGCNDVNIPNYHLVEKRENYSIYREEEDK